MSETTAQAASRAEVATAKASSYLQQLCKHFGHKVPATFDAREGRVEFAMGVCEMTAPEGEERLVLRASAGDAAALASVQEIVGGHLERFSFRDPVKVEWVAA